jgi:hypothetical protein
MLFVSVGDSEDTGMTAVHEKSLRPEIRIVQMIDRFRSTGLPLELKRIPDFDSGILPVHFVNLVDGANVHMVERRSGFGLASNGSA